MIRVLNFLRQPSDGGQYLVSMIFALRTTVAMIIATVIALSLHFPKPFWSALPIAAFMSSYSGLSFSKGAQVILGTACGAWLAVLLSFFVNDNFVVLLVLNFIVMFIGFYLAEVGQLRYPSILATANCILILSSVATDPNIVSLAIWRSSEFTLGLIIAMIVSHLLLPSDPYKEFCHFYEGFIKHYSKQYLTAIDYFIQDERENKQQIRSKTLVSLVAKMQTSVNQFSQEPIGLKHYIYDMQQKLERAKVLLSLYQSLVHCLSLYQELPLFKQYRQAIGDIHNKMVKVLNHLDKPSLVTTLIDEIQLQLTDMENSVRVLNLEHQAKQSFCVWLDHQRLSLETLAKKDMNIISLPQTNLPKKLSAYFTWRPDKLLLRHCFKVSFAITLALCIWLIVGWPGGNQGVVTSIVIGASYYCTDTVKIGLKRLLGCFIGCLLALFCMYSVYLNNMSLLYCIALVCGLLTYWQHRLGANWAIPFQGLIVFCLMVYGSPSSPTSIAPGLERFSGIILGILIMLIVNSYLWPLHPKDILRDKMKKLQLNFNTFVKQIAQFDKKALQTQFNVYRESLQSCRTLFATCKQFFNDKDNELKNRSEFTLNTLQKFQIHYEFLTKHIDFDTLKILASHYPLIEKLGNKVNDLVITVFEQQALLPATTIKEFDEFYQYCFSELRQALSTGLLTREQALLVNQYHRRLYFIINLCAKTTPTLV